MNKIKQLSVEIEALEHSLKQAYTVVTAETIRKAIYKKQQELKNLEKGLDRDKN
jgi:hypothetical protein